MNSFTGSVLAHQGGWDEILMVAAPLLLLAVVLRAAKHRADRLTAPAPESGSSTDGPGPPSDGEVTPGAPPRPPAP